MSSTPPPSNNIPTTRCKTCDDDSDASSVAPFCPSNTTTGPNSLWPGLPYFPIWLFPSSGGGDSGGGPPSLTLTYTPPVPGTSSSDGVVGTHFNYGPNIVLQQVPSGIALWSGNSTQELFTNPVGGIYSSVGNNTAATLTRTGAGTPSDQFTLVAAGGNVSVFAGFWSSIATPGRLLSITDRFGNQQQFSWGLIGGLVRLLTTTDRFGRVTTYSYYGSTGNYLLHTVTDFLGRQATLQYDSAGRLIAAVGPSITRGANNNANTFPNGTGYVFQYDTGNSRPARQNDLIKIFDPNQVVPYIDSTRTVNVAAVYAGATPRQTFSYYNDPTDTYNYGKIQQLTESSSGSGSVGAGAYGYMYLNSGLPTNRVDPTDPILSRTIETDRTGNQVAYDFNGVGMLVHKQVFATRGKSSLEATSWETWTKYNKHNQPLTVVMPEGNSIVYT